MKKLLFILSCCYFSSSFAVSADEVNANLNSINKTMRVVKEDLGEKNLQKKTLDQDINYSGMAVSNAKKILTQLQNKQINDKDQLDRINATIPKVAAMVQDSESRVAVLLKKSYIEIKMLQNTSDSIIAGNDYLDSQRKKIYLLKLLKQENDKYTTLAHQLDELDRISATLTQEISTLNQNMGTVSQKKSSLEHNLVTKRSIAKNLEQKIAAERQELSNLKQRQEELNGLLSELTHDEKTEAKSVAVTQNIENNSPFFSRKLSAPLNTMVIMPFGAKKNQTVNHGILFSGSDNNPVYAISDGQVLYVGFLPGFGQLVVVNHGDNYVSIYGGVLPRVSKGDKVTHGEVIARCGSKSNQPMGGVYFELRHYGRPVNPNKLLVN